MGYLANLTPMSSSNAPDLDLFLPLLRAAEGL
ncbi:MAG: hypothetical protein ACI9X4_002387, partial [Glaciecola sp.]